MRLSVKSKNDLEQAWKQYLASHELMKERNEDLGKDAEIQHRQRKRNFNRALEDLEVYIESLEVNVEVDETPRLLAKENVRLAEVEGERKCNHLESQVEKELNNTQISILNDHISRARENLISRLEEEYSSLLDVTKAADKVEVTQEMAGALAKVNERLDRAEEILLSKVPADSGGAVGAESVTFAVTASIEATGLGAEVTAPRYQAYAEENHPKIEGVMHKCPAWSLNLPPEKVEVEETVADALEENFDKQEVLAKEHNAENIEEVIEEDTGEDKMESDAEKLEEPGNSDQAWQMSDLAKVICGKADNKVKECESLIHLAEESLENSNFKQAVEDLLDCLAKRLKVLPFDSRSMAGTRYQLGLAQAHCQGFDSAGKSLNAGSVVLKTRVENLKKMEVSESIKKELVELVTFCYELMEVGDKFTGIAALEDKLEITWWDIWYAQCFDAQFPFERWKHALPNFGEGDIVLFGCEKEVGELDRVCEIQPDVDDLVRDVVVEFRPRGGRTWRKRGCQSRG